MNARQGSDEMSARLRLPPRIGNRTTIFADDAVIPHPRFGIDGLTHGAKYAQRTEVMLLWPFVAEANERADGRRRGIKARHFELLDDFPKPSRSRQRRHGVKH